jgi:hypothetical protein
MESPVLIVRMVKEFGVPAKSRSFFSFWEAAFRDMNKSRKDRKEKYFIPVWVRSGTKCSESFGLY